MKSMSLMGECDLGVVNVKYALLLLSKRKTAKRKECFLDLNVTVETKVDRLGNKICLCVCAQVT